MTSNAAIYYGAPAHNGQAVSEEVRSRGLNLLRSTPTDAFPLVTRTVNTPQYALYVANFGAAAKAAEKNIYVEYGGTTVYYVPSKFFTPVYQRTPHVVWSYDRNITTDALSSIRDRFGAAETVAQRKPAFVASLSPSQVSSLINDTNPSQTTPGSSTSINIRSYRIFLRLHKLADFFFRLHQYPLTPDSKNSSDYFKKAIQLTLKTVEDSTSTYGTGTDAFKAYNGRNLERLRFNMNLPDTDLSNFKYTISAAADFTSDHALIFPFSSTLAKPDHDMVLSTLNRYMMPLLGINRDDAVRVYQDIKEAWGVLKITLWGDELAHIYSAIRFAFESGTTIRIMTTPNNLYQGFVAYGGGYSCMQWGMEYTPVANTVFASQFIKASPHLTALNAILEVIEFDDDMERSGYRTSVNTMQKLAALLRARGFNANKEEVIRLQARYLMFPTDNYLPITAHNVTRVLTAMTSDESEEHFPLHANAILERDRKKRLLSAFGAMAPSFKIPGGRGISLDGSFSYNVMEKGKKEAKSTTRMFCTTVSWDKACQELDLLLVSHMVYSPIGTPLTGRASSFSLIREFSGAGGVSVLGALRGLCGVSMASDGNGGSGKRQRDGDEDAGPRKRVELMDEF